jgi:hypothetical protein
MHKYHFPTPTIFTHFKVELYKCFSEVVATHMSKSYSTSQSSTTHKDIASSSSSALEYDMAT